LHRSRSLALLGVVTSLALAACGGTDASSEPGEPTEAAESEPAVGGSEVSLAGFAFDPGDLTVAAGTNVTFTNDDSTAHTVTEGTNGAPVDDPIIDEELAAGASTTFTFDEPGTYDITCRIHPDMQLTVTVEG